MEVSNVAVPMYPAPQLMQTKFYKNLVTDLVTAQKLKITSLKTLYAYFTIYQYDKIFEEEKLHGSSSKLICIEKFYKPLIQWLTMF